jgi:homoserine dehydrogenase
LLRKQDLLKSQHDINFSFTGISTGRHGFVVNPNGLDIEEALGLVESGKSISRLSTFQASSSSDVIRHSSAHVMFENSPVNTRTGQPALDHIRMALELGMHAITANKGPVVYGYRELTALAKSEGKTFGFESTVLGGSPVFSVFRETFPLAELSSFKGILNATTNIILSRMESGESYEDAVKYCQSVGVAETDPTNDVDGWDAAIKVAALITVLMDTPFTPQQVNPIGIRGITRDMIESARAEGKRYKYQRACCARACRCLVAVIWDDEFIDRCHLPHRRASRLFDHSLRARRHVWRTDRNSLRFVCGFRARSACC